MRIAATGYWTDEQQKLYHVRCEPLCDWIINFFGNEKDKQLYDFGCGNGQYLQKISSAGFTKLTGFEGKVPLFKDFENIMQQDLTVPFVLPEKGNCIFLEVAEHVPAQFEDIMLSNVVNACKGKMVMSWAELGQPGCGHVNCASNEMAISKLMAKGMIYMPEETALVRATIPDNDPYIWFKKTTMVFKKD